MSMESRLKWLIFGERASGTGLKPVDESNEAYKLGVNYILYGMTH